MFSGGDGNARPVRLAANGTAWSSRRRFLAPILVLAVALSGCATGNGDPDDPAAQTGVAGEESAALTGSPVIGAVIWSTAVQPISNEPLAPVASFEDTASALYAVFPVERFPEGSAIHAVWTFNGTSLPGLDQEITALEDRVNGWLEFHLERSNQDPWPDGRYAISLSAGDVLIATGEVVVVES
ncbi:hypothetical protein BH23CHL4_BH23CHL4_20490 [soil metagenome]